MNDKKIHYRQAFDSPYLSSADIVEATTLTIKCVKLERDHTKKTSDDFNTAYFVEKELSPGFALKPMILNATNSKVVAKITGTPFIGDWNDVRITVYVDKNVRFGKETVEGLRIMGKAPERIVITPQTAQHWNNAKKAYRRDGDLKAVLKRADISAEHQRQLIDECAPAKEAA